MTERLKCLTWDAQASKNAMLCGNERISLSGPCLVVVSKLACHVLCRMHSSLYYLKLLRCAATCSVRLVGWFVNKIIVGLQVWEDLAFILVQCAMGDLDKAWLGIRLLCYLLMNIESNKTWTMLWIKIIDSLLFKFFLTRGTIPGWFWMVIIVGNTRPMDQS